MLEVIFGDVRINTLFLIDSFASPYNVILGRPWTHSTAVVTSTYHEKIKIAMLRGIVEIMGNHLIARKFHLVVLIDRSLNLDD